MKKAFLGFIGLCFCIGLIGCTGGQNVKKDAPAQAPVKSDVQDSEKVVPLEKTYGTLLVYPYETTPVLQKDYPADLKESQATLIASLLMAEAYAKVAPAKAGETYSDPATLLLKIKVPDMRIASFNARFWGGAFAGNSYMHLNMQFLDAASGKIVHEKFFSSTNNAMAATWSFGANDRSLPTDIAKIMADYVLKKVPAGN